MKRRILDAAPPSPRHRMTKRSRNAFTAKEKLHWLAMLESQPDLSIRGLTKLAKVQGGDSRSVSRPRSGNLKKPPPEVILKWIVESWADVLEELVKKAFLTCSISSAEDGSEDHLILAHLRDKAELEVLEDVLDEGEEGVNPNPFYEDPSHAPEPAATKDDEAEDEEEGLAGEEDVVDAAAEEGDVMAPEEEGDEADAEMGGADEWSEDGDDWWAAGRYEGEEVEEWVAGEDE
ncbi:unnamed protein product [Closterium sp. Naga37s-1]|nr:unnamed protein product [Closterium sp. Naga37s-1]